jgi:hypothetical protein
MTSRFAPLRTSRATIVWVGGFCQRSSGVHFRQNHPAWPPADCLFQINSMAVAQKTRLAYAPPQYILMITNMTRSRATPLFSIRPLSGPHSSTAVPHEPASRCLWPCPLCASASLRFILQHDRSKCAQKCKKPPPVPIVASQTSHSAQKTYGRNAPPPKRVLSLDSRFF